MDDRFNLERFVDAQDPVWSRVWEELREGRKRSHWMWFIFPQITGLGLSDMSRRYAITSLDEAKDYLKHPVLNERLRACIGLLMQVPDDDVGNVFGEKDDLKLRSSMTLFAHAAPGDPTFRRVLEKFFAGEEDIVTAQRLK